MPEGHSPAVEEILNQVMPPAPEPPQKAYDVYSAFVLRQPCKKTWTTKVGKGSPWGSNPPLHANAGTRRVAPDTFDGTARVLLSYEHWPLAFWTKAGQLVLNGADGPTVNTRKQQRNLRDAVARAHVSRCLIPFAALAEAGWNWERLLEADFEIVHVTEDRNVDHWVPCKHETCWIEDNYRDVNGQKEHNYPQHFLGETLFRIEKRYFVCGLDRNDDISRRMFYLCVIPGPAKTVDEALDSLRPPGLPKTALRQGEWFLVPTEGIRPGKNVLKGVPDSAYSHETREWTPFVRQGVPVISDKAEAYRFTDGTPPRALREREARHRVTHVFLNGPHVYVRGRMRDAEHGVLKLGDGKTWYRVVKNLAVQGWRLNRDLAKAD